jgi:phosphoribosylaminoimidazole-succinocarboxamide synthase
LKKKKKLYEGRSKKIYTLEDSDQLIMEFKDNALVFERSKAETIKGKATINKDISVYIYNYLEGFNIPTHFIKDLGGREMLVKHLEMIPVEIVMRNFAAGNLCERYNLENGTELNSSIMEFFFKHKQQNNPMVNQTHFVAFQLATSEEVRMIERMTSKINAVLKSFFLRRNLQLIDFKLEYGRYKNKILLGDEISLDTCRLWDISNETLSDKDKVLFDKRASEFAYEECKKRIFQPS